MWYDYKVRICEMYEVQVKSRSHTGGFHRKRDKLRDGNMSIPTRITYIFTIYELNHNKTCHASMPSKSSINQGGNFAYKKYETQDIWERSVGATQDLPIHSFLDPERKKRSWRRYRPVQALVQYLRFIALFRNFNSFYLLIPNALSNL